MLSRASSSVLGPSFEVAGKSLAVSLVSGAVSSEDRDASCSGSFGCIVGLTSFASIGVPPAKARVIPGVDLDERPARLFTDGGNRDAANHSGSYVNPTESQARDAERVRVLRRGLKGS